MTEMLRLEGITKRFGGLTAVDSLSFHVDEGEIVGLIGPNGAGKSTTFNIVVGSLSPDQGRIFYEDERIDGLPTYQRINKGLARTYQTPRPFGELPVRENIRAATLPNSLGTVRSRGQNSDRVAAVAERVGLEDDLDRFPGELTPGELRRLEIARALSRDPDMLLLDEVFAGVTHDEASGLARIIEELRSESGYTFLVVDHVMDVLMPLVDRVIAMSSEKIAEGEPESIVRDDEVRRVYLGDQAAEV